MLSELKNLFWLQWKLTRAMFRSRRTGDRFRVLGLVLRALSFLFSLPMFVVMGTALTVGLILLSPQAAYEAVMLVNTFLFFVWLLLPASYNSQMTERFEMARLFPHPISFRSIVVGSTLMSMLTMTGLWTIPLLAGEVVGLAFHQPLALPLIVLGALPVFALLVLVGRIMDDFFDLVAGDRRLRALVLGLLTLPFMLCWLGQYAIQYVAQDTDFLTRIPFLEGLTALESVTGPSEYLEVLGLSRLLVWLPPGWVTAGMASAVRGNWGEAILFFLLSIGLVTLLLRAHAGITRRLMAGAALSIGAERVRSRQWRLRLPGPPAWWALFRKDWLYLRRSPIPRRLLFSSLVVTVAMIVPLRGISQSDAPAVIREALPLLAGAFVITMVSMTISLGMTANYFGTVDREGFSVLALSALDRRLMLLSGNLAVVLYASAQFLLLSLGIAILTGQWIALPWGFYMGLCLQIGGAPACNFAAIIGPFRTQLKFQSRQRGNMWGFLAWLISAPIPLALFILPYIFWKPGLILTLPLGIVYSAGLYAATLKPLSRLLQRREHKILEAVTADE